MNIINYPILLVFIGVALLLIILFNAIDRYRFIPTIVIFVLITLYLVNALLIGFSFLEIVITLLALAIINTFIYLIKRRKQS